VNEEAARGPDPDLAFITALRDGDDAALDALMERHQEAVFRFILRHVLNEADAAELTQETFVRVYFGAANWKPTAKFTTWLYQIALNLCRDHAKSRKTRNAAVTHSLSEPRHPDEAEVGRDLPSGAATPADEALMRERMAALETGIAQLPYDLRTALVLTVFEQRSQQESAELLHTTPKTVETRVYRARKLLSAWMTKAGF
jgi:RNA polymerase sigma factor (sigma-70 family)